MVNVPLEFCLRSLQKTLGRSFDKNSQASRLSQKPSMACSCPMLKLNSQDVGAVYRSDPGLELNGKAHVEHVKLEPTFVSVLSNLPRDKLGAWVEITH
jgi:hypothetical protein